MKMGTLKTQFGKVDIDAIGKAIMGREDIDGKEGGKCKRARLIKKNNLLTFTFFFLIIFQLTYFLYFYFKKLILL